VSAEVEGRVEKTMAEFGDRLKAGQEIAQIDTTSYEAFARQSAANLAKARASATNAEQSLKRTQELRKDEIASLSDLDKAFADAEQARAEVKAAEAADAIAELNLGRSHVRAPFDSAVADRVASMGDFMRVGSPLFRVVNDNVLKYIVQAPEGYAGQVKKEQSVVFTVDAYPGQTFEGKVYLISPSVTMATRAFPFGALVENPDHKLKASSYARGELILERDVPTPVLPIDAVINFAGVIKVFVVEDGIARSRKVKVGKIREGRQEILAGVKTGDAVVTTGWTKLHDGSKVRIKSQPK
jgi:membrane fusion protein (multidrug efflux system)